MNNPRMIALAAALVTASAGAEAFDESKYPNLKGQWERVGVPNWTPAGKPPFTPEYQAVYEANQADMKNGGAGNVPSQYCFPQGMPMMMNLYDPMEIVITADVTYILISHVNDSYRRIYTDGRSWPNEDEFVPTYAGYSIGKWVDEDGDGRFDALEIETRHLVSDRVYDASGLPFHRDANTVIKERIFLDKANKNILYNEITVQDNALTRPWSITKKAQRNPKARPLWRTAVCAEKQYEGQDPRRALFPERGRQANADPQGPTSARLAIFHPQADRTDWRALISGNGMVRPCSCLTGE